MSDSSVIDTVFSIPETLAATEVISPELRQVVLHDDVLSGAQYFELWRANEVIERRRSMVKQSQEAAAMLFNSYLDNHTKLSSFYKQLVMLAVADKCGQDKHCLDESKDKENDDLGIGPTIDKVEVVKRYLQLFENVEVALPHIATYPDTYPDTYLRGSIPVYELIDVTRDDPLTAAWDPAWPEEEAMRSAIASSSSWDKRAVLKEVKAEFKRAGFVPDSLIWDFYQIPMNGTSFPPILAPDPENARFGVALDGINRGTANGIAYE
jgi:hypothetical protein